MYVVATLMQRSVWRDKTRWSVWSDVCKSFLVVVRRGPCVYAYTQANSAVCWTNTCTRTGYNSAFATVCHYLCI